MSAETLQLLQFSAALVIGSATVLGVGLLGIAYWESR